MRIRRLRLSGFKSFVEPAELRIESGLTGVVGPNGCGKSNLLEAIRWVMGESSAKSMRGGGMEDVIFAGTASRPPRAFAEVVMQAETADGDELEVLRRIERGAGSAYRLNGRDVRAKDVSLIFADAATGSHSPALVSQGRIAAIINAKPTERRAMLEEAAGIAGLHVRRKDAETRLRATETNLARLDDIMAGLEKQVAALRRQARAAERYIALSDQIRLCEARLLFARWRDAAAAANLARAEAQTAETLVAKAQEATRSAEIAQAGSARKLTQARDHLTERRDDATALGHRISSLSSKLEAAEQRLADLDRQTARLQQERTDADRLTTSAADALARLGRELAEGDAKLEAYSEQRPQLIVAAQRAEAASRMAELKLAQATAEQAGIEAEWRIAEAELSQARNRLDRIAKEAARCTASLAELGGIKDASQAVTAAEHKRDDATSNLTQARAKASELATRKAKLQGARDAANDALAGARADLTGIEREHAALNRDREARAKGAKAAHGLPVAIDALRVASGYERALAAVLGRDAKVPLGKPQGPADGRFWAGADTPGPNALPDSLAHHIVRCPPELSARLALVRVVDEDDGSVLAPGEWLVTRDGALRRWDGFVARGEGAAEAARFEADNRFAELDAQLPPLRVRATQAEAQLKRAQQALTELQNALSEAERAVSITADTERSALRAVDQAEDARNRLTVRRADLDRIAADLDAQKQTAQAECDGAQSRLGSLPDPVAGRSALASARTAHEEARSFHQRAVAELAAHDQANAAQRERTATQRADIRGWQARAGDAAKRLADTARQIDDASEQRAAIAPQPIALAAEIDAAERIQDRLAAELIAAEKALADAQDTAQIADATLRASQETLSKAREARAGATVRAQNEDGRRVEMTRLSGERFQSPPPLLPGRFGFTEQDVGTVPTESAEMERLSGERERIGPVNLVAADELAQAEAQLGINTTEKAELTEAVNRLRGSIGNLNREGRERLRAAFEAVDGHFRRLFSRLFQGGQAYLALADSEDPLEAGLEIYAQPPGKRLQSLTLLSGGEQALTAVALIFALFLTNPAPICVLDEVDAPLDDANIERFCDLLDAMVAETQTRYLIVTHNAVTMSRMHRLFGVTMIEKGVSRLVSVDLEKAEKLLAIE